jgi:TRAP-type C4-dicarboxylate transport system substrate-binding protein
LAPGTELTAVQRGNLDMASLAIFDFLNRVPETSIPGAACMFRDYSHMRAAFDRPATAPIRAAIEERTGVKVLATPHIGTRHLNLRGEKKIMTPADLSGVTLRMPGGEGRQFAGKAPGANPTPLPFTAVCTALQTGAIGAPDNPLRTAPLSAGTS